ncbi:trans-L-3-hydroxyproline dehydratase-like [Lytechinus variegatus]|uniref:trans-L-3-hydroxyproline dehydratase-like n=1 Tax=Lytechinus variegatus TaxID=7654 RepID=UPI001BB1F185|nr:trans-L-3-hydroxyproline dehydratase-like [Lytechinus variegatus]
MRKKGVEGGAYHVIIREKCLSLHARENIAHPNCLTHDIKLNVPNYGEVTIDISYGGAFYALVSADQLGLDLGKSSFQSIQAAGTAVTMATKDAVILEHPDSPNLAFLYGTIITDGEDTWSEEPTTNICNFADSQIDKSPCGSGVTARIALQLHKGLIDLDQTRSFRSGVTGTTFTGKAVEKTKVSRFDAVVVEISGKGHYVGESTFICEDDDELGKGFVSIEHFLEDSK